jgi:hypothetical protein
MFAKYLPKCVRVKGLLRILVQIRTLDMDLRTLLLIFSRENLISAELTEHRLFVLSLKYLLFLCIIASENITEAEVSLIALDDSM